MLTASNVFFAKEKAVKMFRAGLYALVSTNHQLTLLMHSRVWWEYAGRAGLDGRTTSPRRLLRGGAASFDGSISDDIRLPLWFGHNWV